MILGKKKGGEEEGRNGHSDKRGKGKEETRRRKKIRKISPISFFSLLGSGLGWNGLEMD